MNNIDAKQAARPTTTTDSFGRVLNNIDAKQLEYEDLEPEGFGRVLNNIDAKTDYDEIKNDYITNGDLKNCNKTEKNGKGFNKYED